LAGAIADLVNERCMPHPKGYSAMTMPLNTGGTRVARKCKSPR
jgi:hypothetical protein